MIHIRKEQMEAFDQAALESFEDRMVEHLAEHFPKHLGISGEECIRRVIRQGIEQSGKYDLNLEGSIRLFILGDRYFKTTA